ncbi:MAG: HAD family phosphatase [Faecalibacterium sp.]|jgi:putative hydrolase of the HAD superfamily|nr:HAD family phosphatase [Faecalibacterium sp.]
MYRNIIFDLGGVMVEWKPQDYLMERFRNAITEKHVYELTFGSPEWKDLDAGKISRFMASKAMLENAQAAGYAFEVQEVIDDWTTILHTRYRVAEIAARLKGRGFRIYYLSNIASDTLLLLQRRSFWRLFDGGGASCDVHVLKPYTKIYHKLLDTYELDPKECIFIDDDEENMKPAFKLGITCIPMRTIGSLIKNLASCGIKVR